MSTSDHKPSAQPSTLRRSALIDGLDAAGREILSAEIVRVLEGRIRSIDLTGRLRTFYLASSWRQRSRIFRAWLGWVSILSILATVLEYLLHAPPVDVLLVFRIGTIPVVYTALGWVWSRPRAEWIEGATLPAAIGTLMGVAGLLSLHGTDAVYSRFIGGVLFAASTAIVIVSVRLRWSIAGAITAVAAYGAFSLFDPSSTLQQTLVFTAFYAVVIGCLIPARRTKNVLHQHAFLLNLRSVLQGDALVSANARLARLASTDALTGLPNRRAFEDAAARLWSEAWGTPRGVGVAMLDIDHFKALNDAAGHAEGDRCLAAVAGAIRRTVAETGLGARYGGEEFICVLSDASPRALAQFAERLRASVEAMAWPNPGLGQDRIVTVSIGIAMGVADGLAESLAALIDVADTALYGAKAQGRNRVAAAWALPVAGGSTPASGANPRLCA